MCESNCKCHGQVTFSHEDCLSPEPDSSHDLVSKLIYFLLLDVPYGTVQLAINHSRSYTAKCLDQDLLKLSLALAHRLRVLDKEKITELFNEIKKDNTPAEIPLEGIDDVTLSDPEQKVGDIVYNNDIVEIDGFTDAEMRIKELADNEKITGEQAQLMLEDLKEEKATVVADAIEITIEREPDPGYTDELDAMMEFDQMLEVEFAKALEKDK